MSLLTLNFEAVEKKKSRAAFWALEPVHESRMCASTGQQCQWWVGARAPSKAQGVPRYMPLAPPRYIWGKARQSAKKWDAFLRHYNIEVWPTMMGNDVSSQSSSKVSK